MNRALELLKEQVKWVSEDPARTVTFTQEALVTLTLAIGAMEEKITGLKDSNDSLRRIANDLKDACADLYNNNGNIDAIITRMVEHAVDFENDFDALAEDDEAWRLALWKIFAPLGVTPCHCRHEGGLIQAEDDMVPCADCRTDMWQRGPLESPE